MADVRRITSLLRFRHIKACVKPAAKAPTEDAGKFSYLVEDGGSLEQGDEHAFYHTFVTKLVDDAERFGEEVSRYPYLKNTRGSAGHDLFHLTNEISYFKQEMDKVARELTTLDFGPKEYAVLDIGLRIARDRFEDASKPDELRACIEGLASKSILCPLQTRKNRLTLTKAKEGLVEAREFSAQCRIGMIKEHRVTGKLKHIEASVREVVLPTGQSKTPPSKEERPRLLRRLSTPWSSASTRNLRAAQPPKVNLAASVPERRRSKMAKREKKDRHPESVTLVLSLPHEIAST